MHWPSLAKLNFDVWYGHLREIFIHSKRLFKKWRANTKRAPKQHWVSACRDKIGLSNYGWTSCQEIFLSSLSPATSSQWLMVIIISSMECAVHWLDVTELLFFLVVEVLKFPYNYLMATNVRSVDNFQFKSLLECQVFYSQSLTNLPQMVFTFCTACIILIYRLSVRIREKSLKLLMSKKRQEEKRDWADIQ